MITRMQTHHLLRCLDKDPIDIKIIGASYLCPMQFGSTHKEVHE